jgi:[protein-PII] uridylyltransferase
MTTYKDLSLAQQVGQISASENRAELCKQIKTFMKEARQIMAQAFAQNEPIENLLEKQSSLTDEVINCLWNGFLWEKEAIALIAVGGYGRGELHPHSDIDLLCLTKTNLSPSLEENIQAFFAALWDAGLEVGHSVRTIRECIDLATEDVSVITNLIESRFMLGHIDLYTKLKTGIEPDKIWSPANFFEAKRKEQKERHWKHNNTEYNLEPNIKTSPGGLRDIQTIIWIAKRFYTVDTLHDLVQIGVFTEEEYNLLNTSHNFLARVRFALHLIVGRDDNRLLFDYQRRVAEKFGFTDSNIQLAVEQLMKRYYRVALTVSELNDLFLQHFEEVITQSTESENVIDIHESFQLRGHLIEAKHPNIFIDHPSALLEVFLLIANRQEIEGIRASTIRLIRDHRYLIDDSFRAKKENKAIFMQLLRSPYRLFTQLRRMKRYGILSRYIPAFGKIIGQMQFDLFHIYTVDAHTLLVIKNMRLFQLPEQKKFFPLAVQVIQQLPKIEILYLAGLFHDMAKGRGGDHSTIGADEAKIFCLEHGLSDYDADLVSWLVKSHLLMSMTAQKKDTSDPDIIHEFALNVGDLVHLDYLYVLTVADIYATNPTLWNNWRASLLSELYFGAKRALRRGLGNPINKQGWINETRVQALALLNLAGYEEEDVTPLWRVMGEDYFTREKPDDIAWHAKAILEHPSVGTPLILIKEAKLYGVEGGTQIFIYTQDQPNLFAVTVCALDQLQLTIIDARIMTSNTNFSLDTYIVLENDGNPIGNNLHRIEEIKKVLLQVLTGPYQVPEIIPKRMPRQLRQFRITTAVTISNDRSNPPRTIIEIRALDRPGLLARLGIIFSQFKLSVHNARIATLGECAEDVFFVTDENKQPLGDPELCLNLQKTICHALDQDLIKQ